VTSLDADDLGAIDRLWLAEAKRRLDEVRSGQVRTIPGDQALQMVRDALSGWMGESSGDADRVVE
jgi:hypothetical protein